MRVVISMSTAVPSGSPPGYPSLALRAACFTLGLGIVPTRAWPASAGWIQPGPPGLAMMV